MTNKEVTIRIPAEIWESIKNYTFDILQYAEMTDEEIEQKVKLFIKERDEMIGPFKGIYGSMI